MILYVILWIGLDPDTPGQSPPVTVPPCPPATFAVARA
jgi:hypothetical protein